MHALALALALSLATPAAHADSTGGDDDAEDTGDTGDDQSGSCTGGGGGVNTGLLVVTGLGMLGLARRRG